MNVRSSPELTGTFPAFGAPAPATEDEAKVIFIAQVFWQNFGMDSLNPHLGAEADNRPDLTDLGTAITHIQGQVDRLLGAAKGLPTSQHSPQVLFQLRRALTTFRQVMRFTLLPLSY